MVRHTAYALIALVSLAGPLMAEDLLGDAARGEVLWGQCKGCHQIGAEAKNRVGPHLNEIFGRKAGVIEGYRYSKGMQRASSDGLTWDVETLSAYVENPKALVSGTRMSYRGLKDPTERAHLLAFLRSYTVNPQDIPESAPTADSHLPELTAAVLSIEGDPARGEYLSSECLTCHKADGTAEGIPGITLWPEEDFVVAMHAYKQKLRPHPVMQMMAGRLNDEEIAALAAYFGALEE